MTRAQTHSVVARGSGQHSIQEKARRLEVSASNSHSTTALSAADLLLDLQGLDCFVSSVLYTSVL